MIKWIFAAVVFITGSPAFSEECQSPIKDWECGSLLHLGLGNFYLLSSEPWQALEEFQKASVLVDPTEDSSFPLDFLITFGQIIAYDTLGFSAECKQAIGSLFLIINEFDDEEEEGSSEDDTDTEWGDEFSKVGIHCLQCLATRAPSAEVRRLLLSLVEEMAEELLPPLSLTGQPLLGNGQ